MRPLLACCTLLALSAIAFDVGRSRVGEARASALAEADSDPGSLPAPGEGLGDLIGSTVIGSAGAQAPLGRVDDLLLDAASGRTRGCIVTVVGPEGTTARRLDLRAEAWEPELRRVRLTLGPRTFASLPIFDPTRLESGTVYASELLGSSIELDGSGPAVLTDLRVDLVAQRVAAVTAGEQTLPWTPVASAGTR